MAESSITIFLNGVAKQLAAQTTISQLVEALELDPARVAIELDREIVPRANWERTLLTEGSSVEIVHFVGGG